MDRLRAPSVFRFVGAGGFELRIRHGAQRQLLRIQVSVERCARVADLGKPTVLEPGTLARERVLRQPSG
jgi:hypothetical protein